MTREQLPDSARRVFDALREVEPPVDLLHSVLTEAEATPQERGLRFGWLPAATTVAAAVGVIVLAVVFAPRLGQIGPAPSAIGSPIHASPVAIDRLPVAGSVETQVTVPQGAYPGSADSSNVWQASESTGEVLRFDIASDQIAGRILVNQPTVEPYDLWPISDGTSVWTAGRDDETLVRIDIASMEVVDRWPIGAVPYRIAPAGGIVWVTDFDAGRVLQVDADSGEVLTTTQLGDATGVAVTADGVWVASYAGDLVRIDPGDGSITARYEIANDATDVHASGDQLWISGINGRRMERFDTTTGAIAAWTDEVTAVAFLGADPWAAVADGALVTLDPVTLEWTAAVPLGSVTTDQMVAGAGRLWAYGQAADETVLFGVLPASD